VVGTLVKFSGRGLLKMFDKILLLLEDFSDRVASILPGALGPVKQIKVTWLKQLFRFKQRRIFW
jgi:hypothetical protein